MGIGYVFIDTFVQNAASTFVPFFMGIGYVFTDTFVQNAASRVTVYYGYGVCIYYL